MRETGSKIIFFFKLAASELYIVSNVNLLFIMCDILYGILFNQVLQIANLMIICTDSSDN